MRDYREAAMIDYARDENGDVIERAADIPFRPEFLVFLKADSKGPEERDHGLVAVTPWAEEPYGNGGFLDDPTVEVTGALKGDMPPPLLTHMWCLDLRACARFGINVLDVARIELPTLDYASPEPLTMRVWVRVREGDQ